jgi:hypothetical protein
MANEAGKGDDPRPMAITRDEFNSNWDKAFANVPLICTACNTEPCDCQGTEDGPGQDEAERWPHDHHPRSDTNQSLSAEKGASDHQQVATIPGQDEASKEVKTHYERRRFDREGV